MSLLNNFNKLPLLYNKTTLLNIGKFNFKNDKKQISLIVKKLIERTEQLIVLNIIDFDNYNYNFIYDVEMISWYFYDLSLTSKYINSKDFIVSFPFRHFIYEPFYQLQFCKFESIFNYNLSYDYYDNLHNELVKNKLLHSNVINIYSNNNVECDCLKLNNYLNYCNINNKNIKIGQYNNVVVDGSFDHMHVGHNQLLTTAAFTCGYKLNIRITSD